MHNGLESTPTVKDAHSPAGQPFYAPASFADLPDCPICKFGTPALRKDRWICIDCRCDVTKQMAARGGGHKESFKRPFN
jgi:hypothetical protein